MCICVCGSCTVEENEVPKGKRKRHSTNKGTHQCAFVVEETVYDLEMFDHPLRGCFVSTKHGDQLMKCYHVS